MQRRIQVTLNPKVMMTVHRRVLKKDKVVYLLTSTNPVKYKEGKSRIVYIGTTEKGVHRIAASAAGRAEEAMSARGRKEIRVFVVSCRPHPGIPTWKCLEGALLGKFRGRYHQPPKCNDQRSRKRFTKKLGRLFKEKALDKVLEQFETVS